MAGSSELEAKWRIRDWFPALPPRTLERLRIYHLELLRWTKRINLISPASASEADLIHFADSILGSQKVLEDLGHASGTREVWDLGSGNGFPGVVLGILQPELGLICVESDERKAAFLKQLSLRLELENLGVRRERVEKLPAGAMGIAVARGFAPINSALNLTTKQFFAGGIFYHFKGPDWIQEVKDIRGEVASQWDSQILTEYKLDFGPSAERSIRVIIKSVKK